MKLNIKSYLLALAFLTTFATYSQVNHPENSWGSGPGGTISGGGDDVNDVNVPIDDYVWVGLIAGVLIGATAYSLRKKQTA